MTINLVTYAENQYNENMGTFGIILVPPLPSESNFEKGRRNPN